MRSSWWFSKLFGSQLGKGRRRIGRRAAAGGFSRRLRAESLESRRVLATIWVHNDSDVVNWDSSNSLREAIILANGDAAHDDINFDLSYFSSARTIQLSGLGELDVTSPISINGTEPGGVTIVPNAASSAFVVTDGSLVLEDLAITGGISSLPAINVYDPTFVKANIPLTIEECHITNNGGDAIRSQYSVTVLLSNISGNGGSGLDAEFGSVVNFSTFTGNGGSGISAGIMGGASTISNSTFSGNAGAGIDALCDTTVVNCVITSNALEGIYARGATADADEKLNVTVSDSQIAWNLGSGARFDTQAGNDPAVVRIERTSISDNEGRGLSFYGGNVNYPVDPNDSIAVEAVRDYLTVADSTIARNRNGGAYVQCWYAGYATAEFVNSTISGNQTAELGGGIRTITNSNIDFHLRLLNVTITNNQANALADADPLTGGGGGVWIDDRDLTTGPQAVTTTVVNSLIAGNVDTDGKADNVWAPTVTATPSPLILNSTTSHHNVIGSRNTTRIGILNGSASNKIGTSYDDPLLTPLGRFGGPRETHAPLYGSPVIDAGDNGSVPTLQINDERGAPFGRKKDGNGDGVEVVDIGAFELQRAPFVVTSTNEAGPGSLRQAIIDAKSYESTTGWNLIRFNLGAGAKTININSGLLGPKLGELLVDSNLQIHGTGSSLLTIDGGAYSRVFNIVDTAVIGGNGFVMINDLTIKGGVSDSGAAIRNTDVRLTVEDAVLIGNQATSSGGAVYNASGDLRINRTTVGGTLAGQGNSSGAGGGAVFSGGNAAKLSIERSKILGNSGGSYASGLVVQGGEATVSFTTIASNTGNAGIAIRGSDTPANGTKKFELFSSTVNNNSGDGIWSDTLFTGEQRFRNSTIDSNGGHGIFFWSTDSSIATEILNCTIAFNTLAGVNSGNTSISLKAPLLRNTIVSNSGNNLTNDIVGKFSSASKYNLIRIDNVLDNGIDDDPDDPFDDYDPWSFVGTTAAPFEPMLSATLTTPNTYTTAVRTLAAGSLARDKGDPDAASDPSTPKYDQSGVKSRIVGGKIDIGAFEYQSGGS